jgi:hypothetical protein
VFEATDQQAVVDFLAQQQPVPDTRSFRVYEGSRRLHQFDSVEQDEAQLRVHLQGIREMLQHAHESGIGKETTKETLRYLLKTRSGITDEQQLAEIDSLVEQSEIWSVGDESGSKE